MATDPDQLQIVRYPDPVLRVEGTTVDPESDEVRDVARRMIDLMHEADGVGLAAPQVGLSWRLFVTNGRDHDPVDRVYMNPELTLDEAAGSESDEEGCLSLPGIHIKKVRAIQATITAWGLDGERFTLERDGFIARIWQHENDHLEGILIVDRMSPMDRLATRRALKDLREEWAEADHQ